MNEHLDYIENTHNFDSSNLTEEEIQQWGDLLFMTNTTIDEKKKALGLLAHVGNLTAYNYLKKYAGQPDQDLEEWATIALGECTLYLHADLSGDDDLDFVFTGVGPNNDMLRIYVLLLPQEGKSFEAWQNKTIENEITYAARDLKCLTEWFDFKTSYASFSLLIPTDISIDSIVKLGIDNCNQFGGFLLDEYYCGTGVPDFKEIEEIIQIVRYGQEEDNIKEIF
ncbi:MAG: hypothetical protein PHT07_19990 [Paludibacter sp.]|nr:hypothetical protein [Paludibacter sp.]